MLESTWLVSNLVLKLREGKPFAEQRSSETQFYHVFHCQIFVEKFYTTDRSDASFLNKVLCYKEKENLFICSEVF